MVADIPVLASEPAPYVLRRRSLAKSPVSESFPRALALATAALRRSQAVFQQQGRSHERKQENPERKLAHPFTGAADPERKSPDPETKSRRSLTGKEHP